jgi:hypothetical protein
MLQNITTWLQNPFVVAGIVMTVVIIGAGWEYRAHILALVKRRTARDPYDYLKHTSSDWKPTGHIDFAIPAEVRANPSKFRTSHGLFHLMIEEHRVLKTISGAETVERRTRPATLADAIEVNEHHQHYLREHPEKTALADPRHEVKQTSPVGQ